MKESVSFKDQRHPHYNMQLSLLYPVYVIKSNCHASGHCVKIFIFCIITCILIINVSKYIYIYFLFFIHVTFIH